MRLSGYVEDPIADNVPPDGGADIPGLVVTVNGNEVTQYPLNIRGHNTSFSEKVDL